MKIIEMVFVIMMLESSKTSKFVWLIFVEVLFGSCSEELLFEITFYNLSNIPVKYFSGTLFWWLFQKLSSGGVL